MEFEEMKKIWDSQNNEHVYAIDEQALHRRVSKKSSGIKRMGSFDDWGLILIALAVAVFKITRGIQYDAVFKFFQGVIFLIVAGYIYWDRKKRLKNDGQSDRTLLGDLEQALRSINHQIRRQRNFVWWFLLPAVVTILIDMTYTWEAKFWWQWLIVVASFPLSYGVVELGLRRCVLPKKEDLKFLRDLLLEEESSRENIPK